MANEKRRLIDANVAKEMILNHANEFSDVLNRREKALLIGGGTSCIDKCPTVDAVEVVRCKDCIHWYEPEETCLKIYSDGDVSAYAWQFRKPDDFCSYGERKDNVFCYYNGAGLALDRPKENWP